MFSKNFDFTTNQIILIFFILIFIYSFTKLMFYYKKKYATKKDMLNFTLKNNMKIGNAQFIGEKDFQNDYFSIISNKDIARQKLGGKFEDSLFAVIADGATSKKNGKFASVVVVEVLKWNYMNNLHEELEINDFFLKSFENIEKKFVDNAFGSKLGATIIAVIINKGILYFASVGNCSLFLYRKGEMISVNDIRSSEIQIKKVTLSRDDVAMLCSRGAYESLTELEILSELSKSNHPYEKCQNMIKLIRQKRNAYQDNATLIVVEQMV